MPSREKDSYSIQSVEHALDLLEALCEETEEVRISSLSKKLGMNKTSVFRLLATFEHRGYVERQIDSGHYRPGLSVYEVSQKFLSRMGLLRKARPVMERLVRQCGEAVYLAVKRKSDILFLDQSDTMHQVKIISLVGRRFPLIRVAAGRVVAAAESSGDGSRTTSEEPPMLSREDAVRIHDAGFDHDHGALGEGIDSLAVPIIDAGAHVVASLVLLGPDFRLTREEIEGSLLPGLIESGNTISSKLGYLGYYLNRVRD